MALGADRRDILALVVREAATLSAIGLFAGALLSLVAARAAESMLFGLKPHDPGTLMTGAVLLAVVTLAAKLSPCTTRVEAGAVDGSARGVNTAPVSKV